MIYSTICGSPILGQVMFKVRCILVQELAERYDGDGCYEATQFA